MMIRPDEAAEHDTASMNDDPDRAEARPRLVPPPQPEPPRQEDDEDRVPWSHLIRYLLLTIAVIFLLLVALDKVIMPWYVKLGEVERVPDVVGLTYAQAEHQLDRLGFQVKKGEPRFDERFPAGTVIRQLPYGGAETKKGRRIYLTISRGTEMTPMTDLVGMPLREARINLMRKGFDIGEVAYAYNDTIMRDLIFSQSIPANVGARPGSKVDVIISRGPSTRFTLMPNLISLDVETARVRLENAGLVPGIIHAKEDGQYVPNTVIDQAIAPYTRVAEGAAVDMTIAKPTGSGEQSPDRNSGDQPPPDNSGLDD